MYIWFNKLINFDLTYLYDPYSMFHKRDYIKAQQLFKFSLDPPKQSLLLLLSELYPPVKIARGTQMTDSNKLIVS